jgi:hypothetical protein
MRTLKTILLISMAWTTYTFIGCAQESFSGATGVAATGGTTGCQSSGQTCTTSNGYDSFNYSVTAPPASADILFVIDNSASMSVIQSQIGNKFPSLLSAISGLDYHIAITTTDIGSATNPPGPANGNGALQSGNLIAFPNGSQVLSKATGTDAANASQFLSTIYRPETLGCEQYLQYCTSANNCNNINYAQNCPSADTRGIYAANLAMTANQASFLRPSVPLAVVIISNSDERAYGTQISGGNPLQSLDLPTSLIPTLNAAFASSKTLSVHSIVVDSALNPNCLAQQHQSATIFGYQGLQYIKAAGLTTNGSVGDICATDFSQQMGQIGASISSQLSTISLACTPVGNQITVTLTPADATATSQLTGTNSQTLTFAHPLVPGTQVNLQFQCVQQ